MNNFSRSGIRRYNTRSLWLRALAVCLWCALIILVIFMMVKLMGANAVKRHSHRCPTAGLEQVATPQRVDIQTLKYKAFVVGFDNNLHVPRYVAYEFTAAHAEAIGERKGNFEADDTVRGCASPDDYTGTGYQRGHMVPAADMSWSPQAMAESFKMTNICPQHKRLNGGGWKKLEEKVREWVRRDGRLLVFAGPVLSGRDATIGKGDKLRVAVPGKFFKVVLAPDVWPLRAIAFIYPNGPSAGSLESYAVSVDEVERLTGLDFFAALPDKEEHALERRCNLAAWTATCR